MTAAPQADNSGLAVIGSNSLADLAVKINAEHEASTAGIKRGVAHAITAGALLIEAREQLAHGQWLPWLEANCVFPARTASHYMRLARGRDQITDEIGNVADLTVREAVALIAQPTVAEAISNPEPGLEHALNADPWIELHCRFLHELALIDPRIVVSANGLKLPDDLGFEKWKLVGALIKAFFRPLIGREANNP
jgi:Protein of unknown function (DUF3102)